MASPSRLQQGRPAESKKPYKKFGGNKNMAFMQSMFEAYAKSQKKPVSLRNIRNVTMTPVTVRIVNRKLGTATRS